MEGEEDFDAELADLPEPLRWRTWMHRVEAALFASAEPVSREKLQRGIGRDASLDLIIADLRAEYADRAFEIERRGGGWAMRTRPAHGQAVRVMHGALKQGPRKLGQGEVMALAIIAHDQPVTFSEIEEKLGAKLNRDVLARLRHRGLVAFGPRSPKKGAPRTFVTTEGFLDAFALESVDDLVNGVLDDDVE